MCTRAALARSWLTSLAPAAPQAAGPLGSGLAEGLGMGLAAGLGACLGPCTAARLAAGGTACVAPRRRFLPGAAAARLPHGSVEQGIAALAPSAASGAAVTFTLCLDVLSNSVYARSRFCALKFMVDAKKHLSFLCVLAS